MWAIIEQQWDFSPGGHAIRRLHVWGASDIIGRNNVVHTDVIGLITPAMQGISEAAETFFHLPTST